MMKQIRNIAGAYIAPGADVMGNVIMEKDSSIWYQAVVRADRDTIHIGAGSNIQDGCVLHTDEGYPVEIGAHVTVGHKAIIHGCQIGEGSLIGMGAIILNGAKIGKNCVVGAGALVTQGTVIPDGMMVLGSPAKVKRKVTEEEIRHNRKNTDEYIVCAQEHFA